jgi:nucleotide-binding universal stress UspA family protein
MRILIAVDGSPHAEAALRFGLQFVRRTDEAPTILVVIKHKAQRLADQADVILSCAREIVQSDVPEVRTKTRIGHTAEQIVREANQGKYDLVIVGEKPGHGPGIHLFPGSTTSYVVDHAPCPVLVAKGKVGRIRRILLCDSGFRGPSVLSRFISELADLLGGEEEVTVLHVMSQMSAGPRVEGSQLSATAAELIAAQAPEGELLEGDLEALKRPDIHPRPEVRHGLVVDEILAEAHAGNYDLVVIGAHQAQGWQGILLDNLAHRIVVGLDRPVLVVR